MKSTLRLKAEQDNQKDAKHLNCDLAILNADPKAFLWRSGMLTSVGDSCQTGAARVAKTAEYAQNPAGMRRAMSMGNTVASVRSYSKRQHSRFCTFAHIIAALCGKTAC